uniref:Uncharacterized protein n=1 Tax=Accipiter nisus TaxID=211598 RepID=A0A8B9MC78_9AVES
SPWGIGPNFSLLVVAKQRHDEEAVIDRGRRSNAVSICYEKEELEGESLSLPRQSRATTVSPTAAFAKLGATWALGPSASRSPWLV